jgi:transcriptional regulator with XRE-family HTH domain
MITAAQMKAARALIGWTQDDLAEKSGCAPATIRRMESLGTGRSSVDNVSAVQRALENGGITFIPENGGGAGVRLAKPKAKD